MKKLILGILISLPFIGLAQQGNFVLKAKVGPQFGPTMAYLTYEVSGAEKSDSTVVKNSMFQFKGPLVAPAKAKLTLSSKKDYKTSTIEPGNAIVLYLENGEINLSSEGTLMAGNITGSKLNDDYDLFKKSSAFLVKGIGAINQEFQNATLEKQKDSVFLAATQGKYEKVVSEFKAAQMEFFKGHSNSYVSLKELIESLQIGSDIQTVAENYAVLSENLRQSKEGKALGEVVSAVAKTAIGVEAPDFTQNDVNDKPVKLSDFKGKFVLLDFWASWCGPCRSENPYVVKAFQQFKDKNFTVLSVSLDNPGKKALWLEAIKTDGLEWTQVSDLKGWNNEVVKLYGIRAVPQNVLINPEGKIIAKNLRGEGLQKALNQMLK